MTIIIDEINRGIIMALMENGRERYANIAKALHLQPMTVTNRVEAMIRDDIIDIRAVPNPLKMGYNVMAAVAHTNLKMLQKFITNEVAMIDGVLNIETLIRGEFKKRTYLGFDLKDRLLNPLNDSKPEIVLSE